MVLAAEHAAQIPGAGAHLSCTRTTPTTRASSYGAARELPDASEDARSPTSSATSRRSSSPARSSAGPGGSASARTVTARLPALAAGRLLRGRGRARDHAEASDHQHPRRATRRPGALPPAPRHHRRREPQRGLDVPQGRDHLAGAVDDRGGAGSPTTTSTSSIERPVAVVAGDLPRPDPASPGDGCATAARSPALQVQSEFLEQARKFVEDRYGADADEQTTRRAGPLGAGPGRSGRRPDVAGRRSSTGWRSSSCCRDIGTARASTGARRSCTSSTCSTATCGRRRGSTTGSWRGAG